MFIWFFGDWRFPQNLWAATAAILQKGSLLEVYLSLVSDQGAPGPTRLHPPGGQLRQVALPKLIPAPSLFPFPWSCPRQLFWPKIAAEIRLPFVVAAERERRLFRLRPLWVLGGNRTSAEERRWGGKWTFVSAGGWVGPGSVIWWFWRPSTTTPHARGILSTLLWSFMRFLDI